MPKTTATVDSSKLPQIPPAIMYRLSEQFFLDTGWTTQPFLLHQERKASIMKAKFSRPIICSWFKERSENVIENYDNGRILYFAKKDGSGEIYYPNGKVAMRVEKSGPYLFRTKVWVYHSGEVERDGKTRAPKLCALFDSLGNGVVYDECWKKRLVYNQEEGIRYGSGGRAVLRWKWHNISTEGFSSKRGLLLYESECDSMAEDNTKTVVFESQSLKTGDFDKKTSAHSGSFDNNKVLTKAEMEFRLRMEDVRYINTGKVRAKDVTPLKPIVMAINRHISLRIMDQANISLRFFADGRLTKVNLGVLYNPYDKFKVTDVDVEPDENEILFPYENFAPNTRSLIKFRKLMEKLKRNSCKC